MVKIRLTRLGDAHAPFYRVVISDSKKARNGGVIENIGTYNPLLTDNNVKVDVERANYWLGVGAQATDTAKQVLRLAGVSFDKKAKKPAVKKVAKATTTTKKAPAKKTTKATDKKEN